LQYIAAESQNLKQKKPMKMPTHTTSAAGSIPRLYFMLLTCCAMLLHGPACWAAPSVVGLWRFNEGSGTNISDSSGLGNNGTLQGTGGHLPMWTNSQSGYGHALLFTNDGSNYTGVSIPGSGSLRVGQTPSDGWSITVWAYESSGGTGDFISTYGRMVVIDDGTAQQLESGASGDDEIYTWARITGAWQIEWGMGNSVSPLLDQWVHWAVTYDGTNITLYRDGNQGTYGGVALNPVVASLGYSGYQGSILIGTETDQPASRNWNGMLDDVAIFAGALSQAQVQTVMSGDFSAFIGGPVGIVSQPQSLVVGPGSTATFSVGADGTPPFHYQWYFNGTSLGASGVNSSLVLSNVGIDQVGTYWVVVSNSVDGITSQQATLSLNPSLVGLWRFDEGSGTNVSDSSGLGNNGTLGGDNGNLPTWTPGQSTNFGNALAFNNDGVNHTYVSIPASPSLMIGQTATNPWTVTAWAYENSEGTGDFVATYGRIVVIDGGYAFQLESGASGDAELYTWAEDGDNTAWQIYWGNVSSAVTPLLDQWEHWAVVYDGTNLNVYLNGNEATNNGGFASQPVTAALGFVGYQGAFLIGSEIDQPATRNWNGMLDDVAVFAGALSQDQIQTVMSGDFSGFMGGPPAIVSQPESTQVLPGSTATFSVGAYGAQTLHYQWYHNGTSLGAAGTNATLALNDVQSGQTGTYTVVVNNTMGSITSQPVVLSVGNLVALWRFNEGSGTTALDASGNGNNGTLMGENGNVPAWTTGQAGFGGALSFVNDGVDHSYVSVPGNALLEIGQTATNPWTITAWAYENSGGTGNFIATDGRIMVIDDGLVLQLESGASGDDEFYTWDNYTFLWEIGWGTGNSVSPLLDQWVHWAVTYDGTNITLYRNGNKGPQGGVASNSVNSYLEYGSPDDGAIIIGSELDQSGACNWNGLLDDVAMFNVALSQAQIQTVMAGDFNGFVSRPPLSISLASGNVLVSWPVTAATFKLQSTTNLNSTPWSNVGTQATSNGSSMTVTLPSSTSPSYFRLVGP
jgi:hypothetical protein